MLLEMLRSRTIQIPAFVLVVVIATITLANWGKPSTFELQANEADAKLALYLERVRTVQTEHQTRYGTYASTLGSLYEIGLEPLPADVRLEVRRADRDRYCVIAEHARGRDWLRASQAGVLRVGDRLEPKPTACD